MSDEHMRKNWILRLWDVPGDASSREIKRLCGMALRTLDAEARNRKLEAALRDIARGPLQEPMDFATYAKNVAANALTTAPPDSEPAEGERSTESPNPTRPDGGRFHIAPSQRRDAGDALREKLADPETMQRVTERAAERQDAMLERREALEALDRLAEWTLEDYDDAQRSYHEDKEMIRQYLSRTSDEAMRHALFILRHGESPPEVTREDTIRRLERAIEGCSDEGTGYNEVAGEVYQAVGVLLSDAGRFDDPDGIALLDACSYLAGNRDNPPDSLLPFESKGTGCVVPEAVRRLPTVMRQDAQLEQDQGDQRVAEAVRYYADELDRAIAEQGGQR